MPQTEIIDDIFREVINLRLRYSALQELFGHSKDRVEVLNSASPIFRPLEDSLIDSVILSIARLFDPEKMGRKEPASLRAAVLNVGLPEPETKQLLRELDKLKESCKPIIQIRHERIAHNGRSALQNVNFREIRTAVESIEEFARPLLARKWGEVGFESPEETEFPAWADRLFTVLRAGLGKLDSDRIARRDEYRRRYGTDTPDWFDPPEGSV